MIQNRKYIASLILAGCFSTLVAQEATVQKTKSLSRFSEQNGVGRHRRESEETDDYGYYPYYRQLVEKRSVPGIESKVSERITCQDGYEKHRYVDGKIRSSGDCRITVKEQRDESRADKQREKGRKGIIAAAQFYCRRATGGIFNTTADRPDLNATNVNANLKYH